MRSRLPFGGDNGGLKLAGLVGAVGAGALLMLIRSPADDVNAERYGADLVAIRRGEPVSARQEPGSVVGPSDWVAGWPEAAGGFWAAWKEQLGEITRYGGWAEALRWADELVQRFPADRTDILLVLLRHGAASGLDSDGAWIATVARDAGAARLYAEWYALRPMALQVMTAETWNQIEGEPQRRAALEAWVLQVAEIDAAAAVSILARAWPKLSTDAREAGIAAKLFDALPPDALAERWALLQAGSAVFGPERAAFEFRATRLVPVDVDAQNFRERLTWVDQNLTDPMAVAAARERIWQRVLANDPAVGIELLLLSPATSEQGSLLELVAQSDTVPWLVEELGLEPALALFPAGQWRDRARASWATR